MTNRKPSILKKLYSDCCNHAIKEIDSYKNYGDIPRWVTIYVCSQCQDIVEYVINEHPYYR